MWGCGVHLHGADGGGLAELGAGFERGEGRRFGVGGGFIVGGEEGDLIIGRAGGAGAR